MGKVTKTAQVVFHVDVTVDPSKFTPEFMEEFRRDFYNFHTIDEHIEFLAQLYARGLADEWSQFVEGYGPPSDFGIEFRAAGQETAIV